MLHLCQNICHMPDIIWEVPAVYGVLLSGACLSPTLSVGHAEDFGFGGDTIPPVAVCCSTQPQAKARCALSMQAQTYSQLFQDYQLVVGINSLFGGCSAADTSDSCSQVTL